MKKFLGVTTALLAGSVIVLSGCSSDGSTGEKADNGDAENKVDKVVAEMYVGPDGQMFDKLKYELNGSLKDKNISADDFTIECDVTSGYGEEQKTEKQNADIEKVKVSEDAVVVDIADLLYSGLDTVTVTCSDEAFNCTKDDFSVATKTADDFVQDSFTASDGTELSYWLYMPENESDLPLMVWEHGGGEVLESSAPGANLTASQGAVAWIENGFDTAVLSVQYPRNYSFGISEKSEELKQMELYNTAKYELIQKLIKEGSVDKNRVYISGASSGGGAALRFIMQYPDLFAGAVVMSAKDTIVPISEKYDLAYKFGNDDALRITDEEYQETYNEMKNTLASYPEIINVPIWFVQAENDQICTSYTSEMMSKILNEMGAKNNRLTLYTNEEMENAGQHGSYHGSWAVALQDKEILNWVYDQKKQ